LVLDCSFDNDYRHVDQLVFRTNHMMLMETVWLLFRFDRIVVDQVIELELLVLDRRFFLLDSRINRQHMVERREDHRCIERKREH